MRLPIWAQYCTIAACAVGLSASLSASIIVNDPLARTSFGYNTTGRIEPPYDPSDNYVTAGGLNGTVFVNSDNLNSLFMTTLRTVFPEPAWTFSISPNPLSDGSLHIHTYDAIHGDSSDPPCPTCVGAQFDVEYVPHGNDPLLNVHWIQIVADNHALHGAHGTLENVVDGAPPGTRSPYYDDGGGSADSRNFFDWPTRSDDDMSHFWTANLLLVTGPAADAGPGKITIYQDVIWGWGNTAPEPSTWVLSLAGLAVLVWRRWRLSRTAMLQ
jgi:hypothetical protein